MVKLTVQGEEFAETTLTPEEWQLFQDQWNELFMPAWSMERQFINSKMKPLPGSNQGLVQTAIQAAKNALDELKFGGFNAGNSELGISPIRPGHVGLVNGGVAEANNIWLWIHDTTQILNGVGFENWIHSPAAGAALTPYNVHQDEFIYPMYIVEEQTNPKIQCVKMDIGRSNVLYYDVASCRLIDNQQGVSIIPLPTTFWLPRMDVLVALGCMQAGTACFRLGGFTIAKGNFLNSTNYIQVATNTVGTQAVASF